MTNNIELEKVNNIFINGIQYGFFRVKLNLIVLKKWLFCLKKYIIKMLVYIFKAQLQTISEVLRHPSCQFLQDRGDLLL